MILPDAHCGCGLCTYLGKSVTLHLPFCLPMLCWPAAPTRYGCCIHHPLIPISRDRQFNADALSHWKVGAHWRFLAIHPNIFVAMMDWRLKKWRVFQFPCTLGFFFATQFVEMLRSYNHDEHFGFTDQWACLGTSLYGQRVAVTDITAGHDDMNADTVSQWIVTGCQGFAMLFWKRSNKMFQQKRWHIYVYIVMYIYIYVYVYT